MKQPIVVVMGVSGSGKSWLAEKLAAVTGWIFAEGDDYHSEANKAKMHAGIPLTDQDREPWLNTLHDLLQGWHQQGHSGILSCSALKRAYREILSANLPEVRFLWLDPPRKVLEERLAQRTGHFMSPDLLNSQLATLEPPTGESNTLHLDGTNSLDESIQIVQEWLEEQE